jgi:gamma-glutamylcyclotransferase (GGCT)/AIG2-like uncharacterized protein YtfP
MLLFVYGTLRRDCPTGAHERYLSGARWLGKARVKGRLYQVTYYPALVIDGIDTNDWVTGEIYELTNEDQLLALDAYEECSYPAKPEDEYRREQLEVIGESGDRLYAWSYVYQRQPDSLSLISSGDFLAHR